MKKHTMSTIALVAFALMVSGTFAAAADYGDVSRNDDSRTAQGRSSSASTPDLAAGSVDIGENMDNGMRGGGKGELPVPPEAPTTGTIFNDDNFVPVCFEIPVVGRVICWN